MKRLFSVAALVAVMLAGMTITANARSWRVNNNTAKAPHFTSINAACSSEDVQAGDTLYLDPDMLLTDNQTVSKTLTIIGPGYYLSGLPYGSAIINGELTFSAANCKMEGCVMHNYVYICAQNVTIERCQASNRYIKIGTSSKNGSNAIIRQCRLVSVYGTGNTHANSANCIIENCIMVTSSSDHNIKDLYSPIIRNNSCRYSNGNYQISSITYGQIYNNIFINTASSNQIFTGMSSCTVCNNVLSCSEGTYSAAYSQNKCLDSTNGSLVWTYTGSYDAQYQLKDDSPAKGYATDGGECGAFGGLFPYVLSGHPVGMPYFESTNTPTRSTNGKVKITQHVKLQTK